MTARKRFKINCTNGYEIVEAKDIWAAVAIARLLAKRQFLAVTGVSEVK